MQLGIYIREKNKRELRTKIERDSFYERMLKSFPPDQRPMTENNGNA